MQIYLRRKYVDYKLKTNKHKWPIDPTTALPPPGWKGWPEGERFSLVLTHDVETIRGLSRCRDIMNMEEELGFRSSFNFVTGDYEVPDDLIEEMKQRGFEVGLHGYHHSGNLYRSREVFLEHATKIIEFSKKWNAVGFRTPSMYHNLEWFHELNLEYDSSTFDTDPFEPQPDAAGTIFPFWVPGIDGHKGFVELPYTLPQDFLLYVLLQQRSIDIWRRKLEWLVQKGGMALFITHPDYMNFSGGDLNEDEFPAAYYREFLTFIKDKYTGQYWHALPRDMAKFWAGNYRNHKADR